MTERPRGASTVEAAVAETRLALADALADAAPVDLTWVEAATVDARWSLDLDVARLLTRLVARVRPRHVVEFGSGLSSLVLGRACAASDPPGHLTSIDHDPRFARATERALAAHGLGLATSVQAAPLVLRSRRGRLVPSYHLRRELFASPLPADLVLIDGPPSALGGRHGTLYQALEVARPGTIVLIDDAARADEREAIARWQSELGARIEVEFVPGFDRGLAAILVRRPATTSMAANARRARAASATAATPADFATAPPPSTAPPVPLRHRVLYYCHDSGGFGHLRRTTAIADEVRRRRPDAAQVMMAGAFPGGDAWLSPHVDVVKLPSLTHEAVYTGLDPAGLWRIRGAVIGATAETFAPHVVLVDNYPIGIHHELARTLARLRATDPGTTFVLGLRDIGDVDADELVRHWTEHGLYDAMERIYDRILIYGSREVFDTVAVYRFPDAAAAKTAFCGYVCRLDPRTPVATIREQLGIGTAPLVVVTTGKGDFGGALTLGALDALNRPELADVAAFVVTGPGLPPAEWDAIEAAGRRPGVTLARFTDDLQSYLNAADLVVTMGGYNTLCEVAGLGKRAIVVPRAEPAEQRTRAARFAELGFVTALDPAGLPPEHLARTARDLLVAPPPAQTLLLDGLARVGEVLAGTPAR